MKTESRQSETRERDFVSSQEQSSVSVNQAAISDFATSNAVSVIEKTSAIDKAGAIDNAGASQPAVSNSQSASFPSQSPSGQLARIIGMSRFR